MGQPVEDGGLKWRPRHDKLHPVCPHKFEETIKKCVEGLCENLSMESQRMGLKMQALKLLVEATWWEFRMQIVEVGT
jgi:hypothetical protein